VDGTLLNQHHQLTSRTRETLIRLIAKDIHIVLATGKLFVSLREIISQLGLVAPQITSGGAIVVMPHTGEVVYRAVIPKHLAIRALELADELGVTILIVRDDDIFARALNEDTDYLVGYGDPVPTLVPNLVDVLEPSPTQLVAVSMRKSLLERFHQATLTRGLARELALYGGLPCVLDILHPAVSKGRALQIVMERLDIRPEEAVALGDGENDISMFQVVGHSIAMGNANARVKQAAIQVTESCDQDGVSKALERLGL
jgi:Cof subfamily protein (haloacid dehalogenase superfamily)